MAHITRTGNFSVSSVEFGVNSGTNIADTQSTALLTLIPDAGFTLTAADFSYTSGPSQVQSVTFAQSGVNVIATVTFVQTATMPSGDLDIPICISGDSGFVEYTLAGEIEVIASANVTPATSDIAYTATGSEGDEVQAFSQTITAGSGYYFPSEPTGSLNTGNSSSYLFNTSLVTDNEGNITAKTFTGNYTFGSSSVAGDIFTIVADAELIPVIVREITSYTISTANIRGAGETRPMTVFGAEGAQFSLTVVNEDGTSVHSITNQTIPAEGSYAFNITFPEVTDNDDYDFVLTGDLAATFDTAEGQPSTFTLNQYVNIDLTFQLTTVNPDLTPGASVTFEYVPDKDLEVEDSNYSFQGELTVISTAPIIENTPPLPASFTNLIAANNGGTDTTITSVTSALSNSDLTYTITFNGITEQTGIQDVLSTVDLEFLISTNAVPVASNVFLAIDENETIASNLVVQLLGYDADGDSLTYTITSLPSNGDLYALTDTTFTTPLTTGIITESSLLYKPDTNFTGFDSFNYKINDGTVDSNTADVTITIAPVNDAPIITSTAPQYTGTQGGTYTYNFTYEDVDNTDAEITITTQSSLPAGWTLTDNQDGTGTLTGSVPIGVTTIVLIATDPGGLTDTETINISAAYDILTKMEFLVSYRNSAISASTASGESPKTTSPINLSAQPSGIAASHYCNYADFMLLVETQNHQNNTESFIIGKAHLGNTTSSDTNYNLTEADWQDVTLPVIAIPLNHAAGTNTPAYSETSSNSPKIDATAQVFDHNNFPSGTFVSGNPASYYNSGPISTSQDRVNYLTISPTLASQMAAATSTGVFTLRLAPDVWKLLSSATEPKYRAFAHSDAAWLQVFKENSAGTNQEEVLDSSGNSFKVVSASNVSIDIFNNTVTVS